MPLSSNPNAPRRPVDGGLAPFATLAPVSGQEQSWLTELLFSPFRDLDERAHYKSAQRRDAAAHGSGRRQARGASRSPAAAAPVTGALAAE